MTEPVQTALTPEQQAVLHRVVQAGHFATPEAALAAAMEELKERADKHARLKREIQIGLESGPAVEFSCAEIGREEHARWLNEQEGAATPAAHAAE